MSPRTPRHRPRAAGRESTRQARLTRPASGERLLSGAVARYGSSDDQSNYSDDEPTELSNYGGHDQPPPGDTPWFRKPVALVAFGAGGALLIALIVYGLAKAITGDSITDTSPTTSLTPVTPTTAVAPPATVTQTATPTATTTEPTTTEPTTTATTTTTTTTPSTTVSTSTVTQTQTETETITAPPPTVPEP